MSGKKQKRNLVSAEVASLLLRNNLSRGTINYLSKSISHIIETLAEMNIQGYAGVDMYQMSRENYGGSEATGRYEVHRHGVKAMGHFFDDIKVLKTVSKDVDAKARCIRWLGFHMLYSYTALHILGEERDREELLAELLEHDFDYEVNPVESDTIGLFRVMMEKDSEEVYKKLPPALTPYDKANLIRRVVQAVESEEEIGGLRFKLETKQFKGSDNIAYTGSSVRSRRLEEEKRRALEAPSSPTPQTNTSSSSSNAGSHEVDEVTVVKVKSPSGSAKKEASSQYHEAPAASVVENLNPLFPYAQVVDISKRLRESTSGFLEDSYTTCKVRKLNHRYRLDLTVPNSNYSSRLMTEGLSNVLQQYIEGHPEVTRFSYNTLLLGFDVEDEVDVRAEYEDFHINISTNMSADELLSLALQKLQQGSLTMYRSMTV